VIVTEAEFDKIRLEHMIDRIRREMPHGLSQFTASALARRKMQEMTPCYKLVRLG
jgi:hypothetical protein